MRKTARKTGGGAASQHANAGVNTTQKGSQETTEKTTLQTTLHPTLQTTLHSGLRGKEKEIIDLMLTEPEIRICEIARIVGLTRDGVNYHIRLLKKVVPLRHEGSDKSGRWVIGPQK